MCQDCTGSSTEWLSPLSLTLRTKCHLGGDSAIHLWRLQDPSSSGYCPCTWAQTGGPCNFCPVQLLMPLCASVTANRIQTPTSTTSISVTMSSFLHNGQKAHKQSAQLGKPRASAGFAHPQIPSQMFTPQERLCLHGGGAGAGHCLINSFLPAAGLDPRVPSAHAHTCLPRAVPTLPDEPLPCFS